MKQASLGQPAWRATLLRANAQELGQLLLAHAVQLGMRKQDGVKYIPPEASAFPGADQLRARLRRAIPFFLELAAPHAFEDDQLVLPLRAASETPSFWHDPALSADLAAQLLPHSYAAQLTRAANHLRAGRGQRAMTDLHVGLASLPLRPEPRARYLRNLAAAYELLGDDAGASWCASRAYEVAPWQKHNLLSHLIYLVLGAKSPDAGVRKAHAAVHGFRGNLCAQELWKAVLTQGARASQLLSQDLDQSRLYREAISR